MGNGSRTGVLNLAKEELKSIDINTMSIEKYWKLMIMNGSLHQRRNIGRLHLVTKEGGRGLTSCEE